MSMLKKLYVYNYIKIRKLMQNNKKVFEMLLSFYLLCNQVVCILHCSFSQSRDYKTQRCIFKIENGNLEKNV